MKKLALTTLISSTLMAAPLVVVADAGQFILTPFAGLQQFDGKLNAGDKGVYGIGGEYQFSERFGVELGYTRAFDDMKAGSPKEDVDYERFSLDGVYYFSPLNPIVEPYLKLGAGHSFYNFDDTANTGVSDVDAGLGLRMNVSELLSFRLEAKAIHELDDSLTHGLYTFGVSFAFGGSKPAVVAPVAAAVVAAPVDSDGDGVYDDKDKCPGTARGLEVDADGCQFHLTKSEEVRIDIKFANNKADITDEYAVEVERVAKFLKKYAGVKAEVGGHTDSVGSDAFNQQLSQRRADAVKTMLVTRFGIDESRLTAVGYGESKPVAGNDTAEGRAQNRRVVALMHAETTETVKKK